MKQRVSAVIISDNKILLIKRVKPDQEYYTLPGGTVEEGETIERAMYREFKEELSATPKIGKLLFETSSEGRKDYYFEIDETLGVPKIGGPELQRMNADNQYILTWVEFEDFKNLAGFYPNPPGTKEKLIAIWPHP